MRSSQREPALLANRFFATIKCQDKSPCRTKDQIYGPGIGVKIHRLLRAQRQTSSSTEPEFHHSENLTPNLLIKLKFGLICEYSHFQAPKFICFHIHFVFVVFWIEIIYFEAFEFVAFYLDYIVGRMSNDILPFFVPSMANANIIKDQW